MNRRKINAVFLSIFALLCLVIIAMVAMLHDESKRESVASSTTAPHLAPVPAPAPAPPTDPPKAADSTDENHKCSAHFSFAEEAVAGALAQAIGVNYHADEWDTRARFLRERPEGTCVISAEYKLDGSQWDVTLDDKTLKTVSLKPLNTAAREHMGTE